MSAAIPAAPPAAVAIVYSKTAAGRQEVAQRAAGLNARQRTVLIMLDGVKPLAAAGPTLPLPELLQIAEALCQSGLIAPVADAAAPLAVVASAAAPIPSGLAPDHLLAIKSFMGTAARHHLGLMAADLVRRIDQAASGAQLIAVLGLWQMAMHDSKLGKPFAHRTMEQLRASFAGGPVPALGP